MTRVRSVILLVCSYCPRVRVISNSFFRVLVYLRTESRLIIKSEMYCKKRKEKKERYCMSTNDMT